ncbi:PAS domain-containing protein [Kordiimonas lipolytica]|uniref:PAS domain-containing protein n=1 Tax=Kordiimonas lipolytica TaxID=1662421 RepID=A0ABV8U9F0_9PROT|nr:PAS domain-containing protein [Kordiimonas lipolytica]
MNILPESFLPFTERWLQLPREAHPLLPRRSDLSPMRFGKFLPQICVTEMIGKMNLPIRYAGSAFERAAGYPLNGVNYYDLLPDQFRKSVAAFHDYIVDTPCGAFVRDIISTNSGSRYLHETLHLPLADDAGKVRYVMAYGLGRKAIDDRGMRPLEDQSDDHIKDLRYLDLGAGAPAAYIENFIFHRNSTNKDAERLTLQDVAKWTS